MIITYGLVLTLAILFLAALVKAVLGFGESLLAIPLLTLVLGVQTATPLVSLLAATVTLLILLRNWQQLDLSATWRLILAAAVGVPLGVWGLKFLPVAWVTSMLGILLIVVGVYNLLRPTFSVLKGNHWLYLFGLLAGLLGGAYNMASPPILVYGAMRRWPPEQFRVTLQSFFLPVSGLILIGHATAGLWTAQVLQLYVLAWPVMLLAFWLGNRLNERMAAARFAQLLYGALVVLGVLLLV
ncbi:MAG: sulfite exporter TauE/SafE family protein [Caldilineaceae bacterium]